MLRRRYGIAEAPPKALFCSPQSSPTSDRHAPCSLSLFAYLHARLRSAAPSYDPHKTPDPPTTTMSKRSCLTLDIHRRLAPAAPPMFQNSSPRNNPVKPELKQPVVRWSDNANATARCTPSQTKKAPAILLFPRIPHVLSFSQGAAFPRALGGHKTAESTLVPLI